MDDFSTYTRRQCVRRINEIRAEIQVLLPPHVIPVADIFLRDRVSLQNEIIAVRHRLLDIEVAERDALSLALQKAQLDAENRRAE